jgi:pimeloyl-ACP methyl ester carboxylesterase
VTDDDQARPLRHLDLGAGPTIVLLHGYGMKPETYLPMARLITDRARVIIPDLFAVPGRWTFDKALACLQRTIDDLGVEQVSLLGHSFGGGLELGLACRSPERIVECVFSDTLGMHNEFSLAREAVHPFGIVRMATAPAVRSFSQQWLAHPTHLAAAAMWAFRSDRRPEIDMCAQFGLPCHVLWAARDTILSRKDGQDFARHLHATFTVAKAPPGYGAIDHDWMFDDPELFVQHLDALGLRALPLA